MDDAEFEGFTRRLTYPMYVLTVPAGADADARPSGCLVGFATQCSIVPVRFLVCVSKKNHTFAAMAGASEVGLHLLRDTNHRLAELFGAQTGDEVDKFSYCQWEAGRSGVPILADCASWFIGRIEHSTDLGCNNADSAEKSTSSDHVGFVLNPVEIAPDPVGAPLMSTAIGDVRAAHQP